MPENQKPSPPPAPRPWSEIETEVRAGFAPHCPALPLALLMMEFKWMADSAAAQDKDEEELIYGAAAARVRELMQEFYPAFMNRIREHRDTPPTTVHHPLDSISQFQS